MCFIGFGFYSFRLCVELLWFMLSPFNLFPPAERLTECCYEAYVRESDGKRTVRIKSVEALVDAVGLGVCFLFGMGFSGWWVLWFLFGY